MSITLKAYYDAYRTSVRRDLPIKEYTEFTKDYIVPNTGITYLNFLNKLRIEIDHSIQDDNSKSFYKLLSTHKNMTLTVLENMVATKFIPSSEIENPGSKFLKEVIGNIGGDRWLVPNCSIKNNNGGNSVYVDELRLIKINSYFSTEIIEMKLANPGNKIVLMNGELKSIPVFKLNYNTVLDWTAPLPYECLEDF